MDLKIVTIVRNDSEGLRRTQDSINEFRRNLKILKIKQIIVDGASNDSTVNILNDISQNSEVIIISENDKSLFDAMNKALRILKDNDLVMYINAGDEIICTNESRFIAALQELLIADTQLLFLQAECKWENESWHQPASNQFSSKEKFDGWLRKRTPVHQAVVFKNLAHRPILYSHLLKIQSDTLLIYELLSYNNWNYIFIDLKIARFYLGGLSNNYYNLRKNFTQFYEQLLIMKIRSDSFYNFARLPVVMIAKYVLSKITGRQFYKIFAIIQNIRG